MAKQLRQVSRSLHLWFALVVLLPAVIVIGSGILLQVKKQFDWVQPATQKGQSESPSLAFEQVLTIAKAIPELEVSHWSHINKLDVRPSKGIIKIQSENHWEAQIDAQTGAVLHLAYRRSNIIEAIHDGSWFAKWAKLWVFLPAALLLLFIWLSGSVLLVSTLKSKYKKRRAQDRRSLS